MNNIKNNVTVNLSWFLRFYEILKWHKEQISETVLGKIKRTGELLLGPSFAFASRVRRTFYAWPGCRNLRGGPWCFREGIWANCESGYSSRLRNGVDAENKRALRKNIKWQGKRKSGCLGGDEFATWKCARYNAKYITLRGNARGRRRKQWWKSKNIVYRAKSYPGENLSGKTFSVYPGKSPFFL